MRREAHSRGTKSFSAALAGKTASAVNRSVRPFRSPVTTTGPAPLPW